MPRGRRVPVGGGAAVLVATEAAARVSVGRDGCETTVATAGGGCVRLATTGLGVGGGASEAQAASKPSITSAILQRNMLLTLLHQRMLTCSRADQPGA